MNRSIKFEDHPHENNILSISNQAFDAGIADKTGFNLETYEDSLGLVYEQVSYTTPYGTDSKNYIRITRPSIDTEELLQSTKGTIDEKPQAEIYVRSPRSYLFNLHNNEKYFAEAGFFKIVVLSEGVYLDILSFAVKRIKEDGVIDYRPESIGSLLKLIPLETDRNIRSIITPR